ncbi:MAG: glycosidase [Candidatus Delongbacteria bacterium]
MPAVCTNRSPRPRRALPRLFWVQLAGALALLLAALPGRNALAWAGGVQVVSDGGGFRLQVDGRDFLVKGVNWDYAPIGTNYNYSLWAQPDAVIEAALEQEMPLLQAMGVNTIRQYTGVPPRWVRFIHERYGIYTVLNHPMGRYGMTLEGSWVSPTDYSDPRARSALVAELEALAREFQGVPGLLMWLLGNENNYGLAWNSAETQDIPAEERDSYRARVMYSLLGEGVQALKRLDPAHPVALANGDLQYLDLIKAEVKGLDVLGTNMYRGISFGDAFARVKAELGLPILFTEFGSDAFDAVTLQEDQLTQAQILLGQWREIYEQTAGQGGAGNAIGGLTFQFSDGWWKYRQTSNLDVHDTNASWSNGGYPKDYREGRNNMNEEWWGICAKGPTDERGLYTLYPRAAYYALGRVNALDPYAPGTDLAAIRRHFAGIPALAALTQARGDQAALQTQTLQRARISGLRLQLEGISTGGRRISTPDQPESGATGYPTFRGYDHLESYYVDVEARPAGNVTGRLSLNILGHVPENPIDEIFYENRGRTVTVPAADGPPQELAGLQRVQVHSASAQWAHDVFDLDAFYRSGHYHWGYEGDFFGLYREANYGPNIDTYNGEAPLGLELTGKRGLEGVKLAVGPQLWWGANPAVLLKLRRQAGPVTATLIYQEDLDDQGSAVSSMAIPLPPTRKATLHLAASRGALGLELGGIWSGSNKVGELFQYVEGEAGSYRVLQDRIRDLDALGAKARVTWSRGRFNGYAQGALLGLVADGGPTAIQTFTGWHLKDSGSGNQANLISGFTWNAGNAQLAATFLWQVPIEGPMPADAPAPARARNVLDDPFAVRANRETVAGELLLTWDPTPGSWMYSWDSDEQEDAGLAASVGLVVKHHPTSQDAAIGFLSDGRTTFAFPGAPPARDLWEVHGRVISKATPGRGIIATFFAGTGEPNGNDPRLVHRYGADARILRDGYKLVLGAKGNDWGPYDYHRDFNLTYPLQLSADGSLVLGEPGWWDLPQTRLGLRLTWRSLDQYSPRYCPALADNPLGVPVCDPLTPGARDGREWEIRSYLHFSL